MSHDVKSLLSPALLRQLRDFWFEHLEGEDELVVVGQAGFKRWFKGGKELDQICVERFAPTLEALRAAGVRTGDDILNAVQPSDPCDWLSLILLLDQMPRNCYRGSSASIVFNFFDPIARDVAVAAIQRGIPTTQPPIRWRFAYRQWFYLPLMHSEDLAAHEAAVEGYDKMSQDVAELAATNASTPQEDEYRARAADVVQRDVETAKAMVEASASFERTHYDLIKRFGRYPHRNEALGRAATAEEAAYLDGGGETFS